MAISEKVKALLSIKGKKSYELAEYFGISPQSMRNKFSRDSFSGADLIKVAEFLGTQISIEVNGQRITLDSGDIKGQEKGNVHR